jgi:ligand-binding sensor protein
MKTDISELIDLKKVSELLEGFNKTTGFVTAILDLEGNVLSKSGWRQMCTAFHRIHPETSKRCTFSDTVLADKMKKGKKYHAYTCLNGLTDVVVPLKIKGQHVANLFSGQFFLEKPDVDFFRKQATDFGFDEKTYISALNQVPIVSEKKVKTVMDFLLKMTDLISELGVEKAEQSELNKSLKESQEALMESDWKFRALFESGPIGVAYHVMVNDAAGEPVNYYFLDANGAYRGLAYLGKWHALVKQSTLSSFWNQTNVGMMLSDTNTNRIILLQLFLKSQNANRLKPNSLNSLQQCNKALQSLQLQILRVNLNM